MSRKRPWPPIKGKNASIPILIWFAWVGSAVGIVFIGLELVPTQTRLSGDEIFDNPHKLSVSLPGFAENPEVTIVGFTDTTEYATYDIPADKHAEMLAYLGENPKAYEKPSDIKHSWNRKNKEWDLSQLSHGYFQESKSGFVFFDPQNSKGYSTYYTW